MLSIHQERCICHSWIASHTHVVTIYKLALGKVRISSHLEIWNSSYFSPSQLHQSVHLLMVTVYLWLIFKLSALFAFPMVTVWFALKPKLSLGGGSSNPGSAWPIPIAVSDMSNVCAATHKTKVWRWQGKQLSKRECVAPGLATAANSDAGRTQGQHNTHKGKHINPSFSLPLHGKPQTHCLGEMPSQSLSPSLLGSCEGTGNDSELLRACR